MKKYKLKNESTSNVKISEVINKLGIKHFDIYMRDQPLKTKQGIINLHNKKGTHWVCYYLDNYFDSYGTAPPTAKLMKKMKCYSTYKIQKLGNDQRCASYCLYIVYLINNGMGFKDAVLKLFFQQAFSH